MARHLTVKLKSDHERNQYCYLAILSAILLIQTPVFARPLPEADVGLGHEDGDVNGKDVISNTWEATWLVAVLSLTFLVVLVTIAALCAGAGGGCCGEIQWFGSSRQEAPLSFSNPITEQGAHMMVPISQIDVRALELDPIVFEPLPTVHDLTPIGNKAQSERGHANTAIPIVPFSTDDSSVYAHDWFEEPHTNFPRSNIEYVKVIGKGWFGQVIEAEARGIVPFATKIRVIVKVLREDANGMEQMRFLDESRIYRDGDHGNILNLLGHSIEKLPFLLIMEHCPQGDLKSFLISNVTRAEMLNNQGTVVKMALDVAKGLEWLHSSSFVHPDLAARNCQVGSENRVVIGDYGLGTQNFKDDYHWSSNIAIPLRWTAPESLHCTSSVIQILKVTESSNIWSLGVVIWEICEFGKLPYFELADDEVITRVIIDKNYYLGRPTLPCMSGKEEIYKIMLSCWQAEIEDRPYLSTIIRQLEDLYKTFHFNATSPNDEFESRWDQLGTRSASEDEKRRKKNVSFVGLESRARKLDFESSFEDTEAIRNGESITDAVVSDTSQDVYPDQSKDIDDTEEEQWTKKIERGDISQKVLEKTQSVQDLMILTHFEQSDMGELDSLVLITKSPPSSLSNSKESESLNTTLKKSSSETAVDSISIANSSHTLTPSSACDYASQSSTLVPPELSITPSTPGTTPNRSGIDVNVITATPNTPLEINVIHATPNGTPASPSAPQNGTDAEPNANDGKPFSAVAKKKLHFKFDTSPSQKSRHRLTSTPLRSGSTPSPRISDFEDKDDEDMPVFDSSGYYLDGTFSISPISQHHITSSSLNSTNMEKSSKGDSSVVFGPSNDHELGTYQGIKSQLPDSSVEDFPESEDEEAKITNTIAQPPKPLPRRVLFPNGDNVTTDDSSTVSSISNPIIFESASNISTTVSSDTSKDNNPPDATFSGNDAFWEQQLKSLQMAAGDTRQLIHSGLNDTEDVHSNDGIEDKRFVEDIEAAAEELGSLVLHDLEETDSKQTVIKEARSAIDPDAGVSAKLAFENNSSYEESSQLESELTSSVDNESKLWDINNSIEIRKVKVEADEKQQGCSSVTTVDASDMDDTEETLSKEFIPSKWNQTLVPSRPAIKSPEQQPRSSMKKSVSFEMKKTQLVYEYPPPPVVSDSEEEEKVRTPLATASLPLSSSLDWELTQEELEDAEINHEDWDDEVMPKPGDPMDVYRISGFSDDNFQVRGSSEPFEFSPSTLGELRHTRDRLRLDLSSGEANFLDEDPSKTNPAKLDSGVGSSTNVSPFNNCDILTKRNKNSD